MWLEEFKLELFKNDWILRSIITRRNKIFTVRNCALLATFILLLTAFLPATLHNTPITYKAHSTSLQKLNSGYYSYNSNNVTNSGLFSDTSGEILLWSLDSNGSFTSPLIYDIDEDGAPEVIVTSSSGSLYVLSGDSGHIELNFTFNESLSTPAIGDLNNDTQADIVVSGSNGSIYAISGTDYSLLWSVKLNGAGYTPSLGKLNKDGYLDVVVGASDKHIYALSGIDGAMLWNLTLNGTSRTPAIGDLDLDSFDDVVVSTSDIFVYGINGHNGSILWSTDLNPHSYKETFSGSEIYDPTLCDYNNDGELEVLVSRYYRADDGYRVRSGGGISLLDGSTGESIWSYSKGGVRVPVSVGDINNDGKLDAAYWRIYVSLIKMGQGAFTPEAMEASYQAVTIGASQYDARIWDSGDTTGISYLAIADFNKDNTLDVLVGTSNDDYARAFDTSQGRQIWQSNSKYDTSIFAVGNLRGTSESEMIICSGGHMVALSLPIAGNRIFWGSFNGDIANTRNVRKIDPDGDTISTYSERLIGTDPFSNDTDNDGLPDQWELRNNFNPLDNSDALADADNDGLTNVQEYQIGTNLFDNDTDDDGMPDGWEVFYGFNPLDSDDAYADNDDDGLENYEEFSLGTNPLVADTDGDGLSDSLDLAPTDFFLPHIALGIGIVGLSLAAVTIKKTKSTKKKIKRKKSIKDGRKQFAQKGYFNYKELYSRINKLEGRLQVEEIVGNSNYVRGEKYIATPQILTAIQEELASFVGTYPVSYDQIVSHISMKLKLPRPLISDMLPPALERLKEDILNLGATRYVSILIVNEIYKIIAQNKLVSITEIQRRYRLTDKDWNVIRPLVEKVSGGKAIFLDTHIISKELTDEILNAAEEILKTKALHKNALINQITSELNLPQQVVADVLDLYKSSFMVIPGNLYCLQESLAVLLEKIKKIGRMNITEVSDKLILSPETTQYLLNLLLQNGDLVKAKSGVYYTKAELERTVKEMKDFISKQDTFTLNMISKQLNIPIEDTRDFFENYISRKLNEITRDYVISSLDRSTYYTQRFIISEILNRSKVYAKINLTKLASEYNINKDELEKIVADAITKGKIRGKISDDALIIMSTQEALQYPVDRQGIGLTATVSIPNYKILNVIGQGGFATVFKAIDTNTDTEVALKIINIENKDTKKMVAREISLWKLLDHANIVKLLDFGVEPVPYMAMELMDGTLREKLKEKVPLDEKTAIKIVRDIAEGLAYSHKEYYMVHRDIKPENILFKGNTWKLSDWGLAAIQTTLSTSGFKGTLAYAAPEQIDTEIGKISYWTDIWQLGVVFYEMLSGTPPFGIELNKIIKNVLHGELQKIDNVNPEIWSLITKMLKKKPSERISIDALIKILKNLQ